MWGMEHAGKKNERYDGGDLHFDINIVPCDHLLSPNRAYLNLDIHHPQALRADIDLNQPGVDGLVELTKPRDKPDRALLNLPERVGARTAGYSTPETDTNAEGLEAGSVNPMRDLASSKILSV